MEQPLWLALTPGGSHAPCGHTPPGASFRVSCLLSQVPHVLSWPLCFTGTIPEEQLQACGASDCLMATVSTNSTKRPSQDLIYTLMGIYTGTCRPQNPGKARPSQVKKTTFPGLG